MRRSVYGLILTLLLVSLFISAFSFVLVRKARATITVPDDFLTIQEAINNASIGDAIYVRNGTYYEHLWIYKRVLLVGENQNTTIIDGNGTGTVVSVFVDNVQLSNFTIRNGTVGLHIEGSRSNILRNNHLRDNDYNFLIVGGTSQSVEYFIQDIDTSNLIEGNPMYYLVSQKDVEIPEDAGYVGAVQCSNITVRNLNLTKNGTGVLLVYSNNSLVENVYSYNNYFTGISLLGSSHSIVRHNRVFSNGWRGIVLWYSTAHSNLIYNNTIVENGWASGTFENGGIVLVSSGGNTICHNNFTYNRIHARVTYGYTNVWDDGYPSGGNYWSNYAGTDSYRGPLQNVTGSDGIGDMPFVIDSSNQDNYPLMKQYGGPHDIGITTSISKTIVGHGYNTTITTKVTNYGILEETFNLAYCLNTTIQNQTLILASRDSTILIFELDTGSLSKGNYTVFVEAGPVLNETELSDNTFNGWLFVTIPGDINGDKTVDIIDAILLAGCFGIPPIPPIPPHRNPNTDINGDGIVDIIDAVILASHFGETWA